MLQRIGQGLFYQNSYIFNSGLITNLSFDSALPIGFTYTRNDAVAMYRDNGGDWVNAAVNEPLFDHDASGNPLGLRFDVASTNKCSNVNWQMTDLTGITQEGNGSATISVSTHPVHGFPTLLIDNTTGGSGSAYVEVSGAQSNANVHSASVHFYAETQHGGYALLQEHNGAQGISGSGVGNAEDGVIKFENYTPTGTSKGIRLGAVIGSKIHFWLNQLEEQPQATPPIYVNGSSSTRAQPRLVSSDIATFVPAFDVNQGAIIIDATANSTEANSNEQWLFNVSDGSSSDSIGLYLRDADENAQMRGSFRGNNSSQQNSNVARPINGHRYPAAITWGDGESVAVSGNLRTRTENYSTLPIGLNRFDLGSKGYVGAFGGHIRSIKVFDSKLSLAQIATHMYSGHSLYGFVNTGQSNAAYMFEALSNGSTDEYGNAGESSVVAQMNEYNSGFENWFIDAASGGASVYSAGGGFTSNFWLDEVANEDGPLLTRFKERTTAFGVSNIHAIHWDQGETNVALSTAEYELYAQEVFDRMRAHIGDVPVIITKLGRRGAELGDGYNNIREAQRNLIANNSWCHEAPTKISREMDSDGVHLSDAGFGAHGESLARKILDVIGAYTGSGSVDGMRITGVTNQGAGVFDFHIQHDQENDFVPTTGIEGIRIEEDGAPLTLLSAEQLDGSTIRATASTTPTGTIEVYYGYGSVYDGVTDTANLVIEDGGNNVPLQTYYGEL